MGKQAKSPPSPDPQAVANSQTSSNIATATANTWLANPNVTNPYGSSTTTQQFDKKRRVDKETGTYVVDNQGNPVYDKVGKTQKVKDPVSGKTYEVPLMQVEQKLSPDQQKLLDQQEDLGMQMNDIAGRQMTRIDSHLSTPFSIENDPNLQDIGGHEEYQKEYEAKLLERAAPQWEKDREQMSAKMANMGFDMGSTGYKDTNFEQERAINDARTGIYLQSGAEGRNALASDMSVRQQQIQEKLTDRNQPINEITALMNGGQVTVPQFQQFNPGNVADVDVGGYTYKNWDQNNTRNQQNAAANGQAWSTAGDIAGGFFKWSDERLKTDIRLAHTDASGIQWYRFRYRDAELGLGEQFGVMAQQVMTIRPDAVVLMPNGFYAVNYGAL